MYILSCIIARIRGYAYKVVGVNYAILLHLYGYDAQSKILIKLKFMLTDNNQICRNCFVTIYCHLTKVLSQINKCIIFEPNELYITIYSMVPSCCCSRCHQWQYYAGVNSTGREDRWNRELLQLY